MILDARGLVVRYPGAAAPAVNGVDLAMHPGELVAVVGPNGSGKTTLLRAVLGLVPLTAGQVSVAGRPLGEWARADLAQTAALVPQREDTPFSWTVDEMVGFGRYARLGALSSFSRADREAIDRALARCDVTGLRARRLETLSGGEWQRVRVARALAQEPRLLALDEPTASLDLGHEMALFELVRSLVAEGMAGLIITHHLSLAGRFADRLLLVDRGSVIASGPPAAVLTPELVEAVFQWPVAAIALPDGGREIVPLRSGAQPRGYS
jgi:iron complex transport system ATP-binding protein